MAEPQVHRGYKKEQKKIRFANVFFYGFSFLIFAFIVYYFKEIRSELLLFKRLDGWWVLGALLAQGGTYIFNTLVYYNFLRLYRLSKRFSVSELLRANVVVLLFNQSVPSVGLSGNAFYFNFLTKRGVSKDGAYSLILVELLSFYIAILLIFVLFLGLLIGKVDLPVYFLIVTMWGIALYASLSVFVGILGKEAVINKIVHLLERIPLLRKIKSKISQVSSRSSEFHNVENPWKVLFAYPLSFLTAVFFQWGVLLLDTLTIYALFRGLHIDASFGLIFMCFLLTKVVAALPLSPGELLVYESSMTFLFVSVGIPFGAAAIVTLLYRILSFWTPIPLGIFLYRTIYIEEEIKEPSTV
jgi:uncharacterized protein (TIRG00374 family)